MWARLIAMMSLGLTAAPIVLPGAATARVPLPTSLPEAPRYRWTSRGGDADWHNPRNWSVGGRVATRPPSRNDDCLFDSTSFRGMAERVEIHQPAACHDMLWRRVHGAPVLSGGEIEIAGMLVLDPSIGPLSVSFRFTSEAPNQVVDLAGRDASNVTLRFDGGGSWHFRSGLRAPRLFSPEGAYILIYRGTVHFGALTHEIRALVDETTPSSPAVLHLGGSALVVKDAWQRRARDSGLVIHGERATLHCIATRDFFSFEDAGTHYHHVVVWPNVIAREICQPDTERCDAAFVTATQNTRINHFVAHPGTILESTAGSDLEIGRLDIVGRPDRPITWKTSLPGQPFHVAVDKAVNADYCHINGATAAGRQAPWRAGPHCTDGGDNHGWNFPRWPNLPDWLQP